MNTKIENKEYPMYVAHNLSFFLLYPILEKSLFEVRLSSIEID